VLQCVAVCCSALQRDAACCSVVVSLGKVCAHVSSHFCCDMLQCVAACCSKLQRSGMSG